MNQNGGMMDLCALIQAARNAEAEDIRARAAHALNGDRIRAEIASTIDADGQKFVALLDVATTNHPDYRASYDEHVRAVLALNAARTELDIARAELDERTVIASERQATAFEAAEARQQRWAAEVMADEIGQRRITPPPAS